VANYPANSAGRAAIDRFNQDYRDLLELLQNGSSGDADALSTAFQKMSASRRGGVQVDGTTPADGDPLGPSFEYMLDP